MSEQPTPRTRKIAALVAVGVLAAGAGALATKGTQSDAAGSSSAAAGPAGAQRGGGPPGMDLGALADKLGVSEARLKRAMAAIRPSRGSQPKSPQGSQPPQGGSKPPSGGGPPRQMAAALAKKLGLSTAKVEAALRSLRPEGVGPMR
jgi:biotin operon repressor